MKGGKDATAAEESVDETGRITSGQFVFSLRRRLKPISPLDVLIKITKIIN